MQRLLNIIRAAISSFGLVLKQKKRLNLMNQVVIMNHFKLQREIIPKLIIIIMITTESKLSITDT